MQQKITADKKITKMAPKLRCRVINEAAAKLFHAPKLGKANSCRVR